MNRQTSTLSNRSSQVETISPIKDQRSMNDYSDNGINKVYSVRNHHLAPVNQNLDNSVSFKALSPAKLNFHSVEDQHLSMNRNNGSLKAAHQVNINLSPPLATPIIMPNLQEDSLKK